MRRWLGSILCAALCAGCGTQTLRLRASDMTPTLHAGPYAEAVIIRRPDGLPVRLSAGSDIRFLRTDGARTAWVSAGDLRVQGDALRIRHRLPLSLASAVRVQGLGVLLASALHGSMPAGAQLVEQAGGDLEMRATGATLEKWIVDFFTQAALLWEDEDAYARYLRSAQQGGTTPDSRRDVGLWRLRLDDWGRPLGRWAFYVDPQGWLSPLPGAAFLTLHADLARVTFALPSLPVEDGLHLSDVLQVDVKNISGAYSLGLWGAAVTTLSAWMLGGRLAASLSGRALDTLLDRDALADESANDARLWRPGLALPQAGPGRPLFYPSARRRAIVQVVSKADTASELHDLEKGFSIGAFVGLRLWDVFEFGAGPRYLYPRLPPQDPSAGWLQAPTLIAVVSHSAHLPLDVRHRVAALLGLDLGGGGDAEVYVRFALGLRVRVATDLFVGAYPWNPTYINYNPGAPARSVSGWMFPSSLELGGAF